MPAGSAEKRCGLVMDWSHPAANLLPSAYARWRQSRLGRITDALEQDLVAELVGRLDGRCVLDVGCGDGALAEALARAGAQVTGIDADPHMLAAARERLAAARLEAALLQADAQAQPFGDARFDVVVAVTVLCLLHQPERALAEMARVLKPGGRLVIGELGRWSWWAAWRRVRGWLGHPTWCAARFWTPRELQRLVTAAGLEVRTLRAAVFYPPFAPAAGVLAPLDPWLGRRLAIGGAFLALLATKTRTGSGR
jgi:ubiquinone biosynthesis O-methyltransferase